MRAATTPTPGLDSAPLLRLDGVCAGYGDVDVLHDVSLDVGAGELVALLGANGAGKTTTILTVAGFVAATAGEVVLLGEAQPARRRPSSATVVRRARSGIAVVVDDRGLFANLTVDENLRLGRPRRGGVDDEQLFDWFVPLARLRRRKAGLLSGGEQQMLALARALVARPRLVVIDEMSMGLAPLVAEQLLGVVRRVATDTGTGVLVVEQHVGLALEVVDRGYVLQRGRIVLAGTAAQLAAQRDDVAEGYLGS